MPVDPDASAPNPRAPQERLDSWKEIAAYLGRGVTTVQRWEQDEGLPVRRLPHAKKGSVFAYRHELDTWLDTRAGAPPGVSPAASAGDDAELPDQTAGSPGRVFRPHPVVVAGLLIVTALAIWWSTGDLPVAGGTVERAAAEKPLYQTSIAVAAEPGFERGPSLSPDGQSVVYAWDNATSPGLYRRRLPNGLPELLVAETPGRPIFLARWSPRGDLIAVIIREGVDRYSLAVLPAGGGELRRLTSMAGLGACWTPDGDSLAFVDRTTPADPFSVFVISSDGRERRRLTQPPAGSFGDTACSYSPDGRRLAVARFPTRYEADIHLIDSASGLPLVQLTRRAEGINDLAWSPDGRTIVFGTFAGLWQVDPDDGDGRAIRVTPEGPGAGRPQWARSNRRSSMALTYQQELRTRRIVAWRSDAPETTRILLPQTSRSHVFPALSPDGRRVALESDGVLWTVNADGTDLRRLGVRETSRGDGPVAAPQWSPDGGRIAYSASTDGQRDVYVVGADGSGVTRLTSNNSLDDNPSWSHDGQWIYFRSNRGGINQIWKTPVSGGEALLVTEGQASQAYESADGRLLYFVRDTMQPGLWVMAVGGGTETLVSDEVFEHFWALSDVGITFMSSPAGATSPATLKFLRFEDRSVHVLAQPGTALVPGLAVSRDGTSVLWSRTTIGVDVMLIDPWIGPASEERDAADRER